RFLCSAFLLHARALAAYFGRLLVITRAEVNGLAKFSIACPFAELHLDNNFRLHPMRALVRLWDFFERRLALLEWCQLAVHLRESRASEPSTSVTDVNESIAIVVAEKKCADVLT